MCVWISLWCSEFNISYEVSKLLIVELIGGKNTRYVKMTSRYVKMNTRYVKMSDTGSYRMSGVCNTKPQSLTLVPAIAARVGKFLMDLCSQRMLGSSISHIFLSSPHLPPPPLLLDNIIVQEPRFRLRIYGGSCNMPG